MSDLSKEFHVDKNSEMGWMGQQLANRGIVDISFHPDQPERMIIKSNAAKKPVFMLGDGTVLFGVEELKNHLEQAFGTVITVMGEEMQRQVAAERQRCANIVRSGFDSGIAGIDGYHEALNIHLENLAAEIESGSNPILSELP